MGDGLGGSSMVVRQFVDLARGWMPVHTPSQPWRVLRVEAVDGYCLRCSGVRRFDVVVGVGRSVRFCRVCGLEAVNGQ